MFGIRRSALDVTTATRANLFRFPGNYRLYLNTRTISASFRTHIVSYGKEVATVLVNGDFLCSVLQEGSKPHGMRPAWISNYPQ